MALHDEFVMVVEISKGEVGSRVNGSMRNCHSYTAFHVLPLLLWSGVFLASCAHIVRAKDDGKYLKSLMLDLTAVQSFHSQRGLVYCD